MHHRAFLTRRHFTGLTLGSALLTVSRPIRAQTSHSSLSDTSALQTLTDYRGRSIALHDWQHIVVSGGTITETLYALNADHRITAIDSTSTWPEKALKEKPSIGYMRNLSAEGILSLNPDLILAMNNSGPDATLSQLVTSKVPVFFVNTTPSPQAIIERTRILAKLVDKDKEGEVLCQNIQQKWDKLTRWRQNHIPSRKVLFILRIVNGRPLAAGQNSAAEQIITLAGAIPALQGITGYKILNSEALININPDVILIMSQDEASTRKILQQDAAFKMTSAGKNNAIIAMEGEQLLGFGPRTAEAAFELAQSLQRF